MNNRYLKLALLAVTSSLIVGCAFKPSAYGVSVANVETLKASNLKPMAVSRFESAKPGLTTIMCRGAGPVTVEPSYEAYIEKALIDELRLAGAYNAESPLIIKGRLDEVDFSSSMSQAKWMFTLTISNTRDESFTTKSEFQFPASFVGDRACQEVAQAFTPAVQQLIKDVISHSDFKQIAQ